MGVVELLAGQLTTLSISITQEVFGLSAWVTREMTTNVYREPGSRLGMQSIEDTFTLLQTDTVVTQSNTCLLALVFGVITEVSLESGLNLSTCSDMAGG